HKKNVDINGKKYYVCYVPVYGENNVFWGMAFAGTPNEKVEKTISSIIKRIIISAVILVILCGILLVIVARRVTKPVNNAIKSVEKISQGELNTEIDTSAALSDTKLLTESVLSLRENLSNIVANIMDNSVVLNDNMDNISDNISACKEETSSIVDAVSGLSSGARDMAESVQTCAEKMSDMGSDIDIIADLTQRTSQNARTITSISDSAQESLNSLIEANKSTIQVSKEVADGILDASNTINEINKVTKVITDIASQTTLLALNASIEAARAGEAGRGFAVVAEEISGLATQSDASAKEIRDIVLSIVETSDKNVALADKIRTSIEEEGNVLGDVRESFGKVNECVTVTNESIDEMANKISDLNSNKVNVLDEITTLSSISQENVASAQETNESCEKLNSNIQEIDHMTVGTRSISTDLRENVDYFKLS
nr:cache domain-containing protein [Lachnospiraceae bacterium]